MGHDILEYCSHSEIFSDLVLWVLRCFLLAEAERREEEDAAPELSQLREFFRRWEWVGVGVILGTDLEGFIAGSEPRRALLWITCIEPELESPHSAIKFLSST